MNTLHNSTTHADNRLIVIAIVLATILTVGVIGPDLAQLRENMDGSALANYLAAVGKALGTG